MNNYSILLGQILILFQKAEFYETLRKTRAKKGTSPNTVLIQICITLIAILILKYMQFRSTFSWSLSNLIAMLRYNLFTYRDLWKWLNKLFETPPIEPETYQPSLFQD
jgi:hypothetical protein